MASRINGLLIALVFHSNNYESNFSYFNSPAIDAVAIRSSLIECYVDDFEGIAKSSASMMKYMLG